MKQFVKWAFGTAVTILIISVAPAIADDSDSDVEPIIVDDNYIDVAPLDEEGSAEYLREVAGSGFDVPGPFYIVEDDYDSGNQGDGTWVPDVPDVPPPTIVEDEEVEEEEVGNRRR